MIVVLICEKNAEQLRLSEKKHNPLKIVYILIKNHHAPIFP